MSQIGSSSCGFSSLSAGSSFLTITFFTSFGLSVELPARLPGDLAELPALFFDWAGLAAPSFGDLAGLTALFFFGWAGLAALFFFGWAGLAALFFGGGAVLLAAPPDALAVLPAPSFDELAVSPAPSSPCVSANFLFNCPRRYLLLCAFTERVPLWVRGFATMAKNYPKEVVS